MHDIWSLENLAGNELQTETGVFLHFGWIGRSEFGTGFFIIYPACFLRSLLTTPSTTTWLWIYLQLDGC